MNSTTLTRARILAPATHSSSLVDITISDGLITRVGASSGTVSGCDLDGALVVPGLWDCHAHMSSAALISICIDLTHCHQRHDVVDAVLVACRTNGGTVLGYGFRAGTWQQPPTAAELDAVSTQPIALISGDMHAVWCNTAGLETAGHVGHPTGYLVENDAFDAIVHLMHTQEPLVDGSVSRLMDHVASRGVTGVVDMEMSWSVPSWRRRASTRQLPLRIEAATYPQDLDALLELGVKHGDVVAPGVQIGPLKIIADGSMSTKTARCITPYHNPLPHLPHGKANHTLEELTTLMHRARQAGIHVAVHAIGDLAAKETLDAFAASGARGSLEHAQLMTKDDITRCAALGIIASVQPAHLIDDEPLIAQIWPGSKDRVFPLRDLLDAGVSLRFGSDAPVAALDPWIAMDVAVNRHIGLGQAITPIEALQASIRSFIAAGQPADLTVVDLSDEDFYAGRFAGVNVLRTILGGRDTYVA